MKTHYAGSQYIFANTAYLLAMVAPGEFQLINMRDGNRWDEPYSIDVKNRWWLTEVEFLAMINRPEMDWIQIRNAEMDHR